MAINCAMKKASCLGWYGMCDADRETGVTAASPVLAGFAAGAQSLSDPAGREVIALILLVPAIIMTIQPCGMFRFGTSRSA